MQCPSTLLGKNFEKLVQCDQRLNQLSQQADIILDPPVFEPRCSIFEDPVELKCHAFANLKDEHEDLPGFSGSVSPCGSSMSAMNEATSCFGKQPEFLAQTVNPGTPKSEQICHFDNKPWCYLDVLSQNRSSFRVHVIFLENFSLLASALVILIDASQPLSDLIGIY